MSDIKKIYSTRDSSLAATLYGAGCRVPKDSKGNDVPWTMEYTAAKLKDLGYVGWELEKAARDAFYKGRMGDTSFHFLRTSQVERIVKAYSDQSKVKGAFEMPHISDQDYARICYQYKESRRKLFDDVKKNPTPAKEGCVLVVVQSDSHFVPSTEYKGAGEVRGSFKKISLNAGRDIRDHLGI